MPCWVRTVVARRRSSKSCRRRVRPTQGTAAIFGYDIQKQADEVRRRIGVVFQNPSLDKKLTVLENLRYHGQLYGCAAEN